MVNIGRLTMNANAALKKLLRRFLGIVLRDAKWFRLQDLRDALVVGAVAVLGGLVIGWLMTIYF